MLVLALLLSFTQTCAHINIQSSLTMSFSSKGLSFNSAVFDLHILFIFFSMYLRDHLRPNDFIKQANSAVNVTNDYLKYKL